MESKDWKDIAVIRCTGWKYVPNGGGIVKIQWSSLRGAIIQEKSVARILRGENRLQCTSESINSTREKDTNEFLNITVQSQMNILHRVCIEI